MSMALYDQEIDNIETIKKPEHILDYAKSDPSLSCLAFVSKTLSRVKDDQDLSDCILSLINEVRRQTINCRSNICTLEERINTYEKEISHIRHTTAINAVNEYAPHPEYTFSAKQISIAEMREVKGMLRYEKTKGRGKRKKVVKEMDEFRPDINYKDQYMLWFERGFTIYTKNLKDLDVRFQGIAQILLEKYGVQLLFSDISYAYGVNLPIRTVVFYNPKFKEIGLEELPIILAHQAQGRGARRGLDTKGYVVEVFHPYIRMQFESNSGAVTNILAR
jgi:replicative superfamily II helicase